MPEAKPLVASRRAFFGWCAVARDFTSDQQVEIVQKLAPDQRQAVLAGWAHASLEAHKYHTPFPDSLPSPFFQKVFRNYALPTATNP